MSLFDETGQTVPKTAASKALGASFRPKHYEMNQYHDYAGVFLVKGQPAEFWDKLGPPPNVSISRIKLGDYFVISHSGRYRVEFELGVVWLTSQDKHKDPKLMFLPPVKTELDIKLDDSWRPLK